MLERLSWMFPLLLAGITASTTAEAQTWRTVNSARQVWDKAPLDVQVEYGAGELRLEPAEAPLLYQLEMRYNEDAFAPITQYDSLRHSLRLGIEGRERRSDLKVKEGSRATISLTREVPLSLDLEFGAGEAEIDLGGLTLERLKVSTGASETRINFSAPNLTDAERVSIEAGAADLQVRGLGNTRAARLDFQGGVGSTLLDFGGEWRRNATATVKMGIGSVVLRFPRDLGVRLTKDSFLTSFDSEGLINRGGSYYSPNWATAAYQLTLDVDAAFGSIKVEWLD